MWLRTLGIVPLTAFILLAGCSKNENLPTASSDPILGSIPVSVENTQTKTRTLDYDPCGEPKTVNLMAGQHFEAGTLTISNNDTHLKIVVETKDGWKIGTSHLHLALNPSDIPTNKGGNPKIGQFDYIATYDPLTTFISYTFSLADIPLTSGELLYIAFHAEVFNQNSPEGYPAETAWGEGPGFPGNSWAMYMSYEIQPCDPDDPDDPGDGEFRTQTQGGWGTVAQGNNPGTYRDAHFSGAFPTGLTIGSRYSAQFTSAYAIETFLPQGGTASAFTMDYSNPTFTSAGVFAGQVVALTLSVGFDDYDPNFSTSTTPFKNLTVADVTSPLYGKTVEEVLAYANDAIGDLSTPYSISQLNDAVSKINESYVDGFKQTDFLME